MHKLKLIALLSITSLILYSFTKKSITETGINFYKGSFEEALLKANDEKKVVFLDVFTTWCGPCKKLKKSTFKNNEVGVYFNQNFISIAIDGETVKGKELVKKYNIEGYPTIMIIDKDGKLLAKSMGFMQPDQIINWGKTIVP